MVTLEGDVIKSPKNSENPHHDSLEVVQNSSAAANGEHNDSLFSPRFRSVAAMAGWDEEALMVATLVVEDTPDRQQHLKHQKNQRNNFKTPPSTNSRRKRRAQRRSPTSLPVVVLNLEEEDTSKVETPKESVIVEHVAELKKENKASGEKGTDDLGSEASTSSHSTILCMDRLREELSCAICLEICFEPSTTPCGHSFCKKCLRSAADKCGKKCPKCRQLISNGRSCTVNTVLWNTIQLLFPQEVQVRQAAAAASASNDRMVQLQQQRSSVILNTSNVRHRHVQELRSSRGADSRNGSPTQRISTRRHGSRPSSRTLLRRNELPSQDEDAALALRLQREEFMGMYGGSSSDQEYTSSLAVARANLRAMASRAIRGR